MLIRALPVFMIAGFAVQAQAAEAIRVELIPKAQRGQGQPRLVVHAQSFLRRVDIDVRRGDGHRVRATTGPLRTGQRHAFELPHRRPGAAAFEGRLAVVLNGGETAEMPINVQTVLLEPLSLSVVPNDLDVAGRRAVIESNRPLSKVRVRVTSDTGRTLEDAEVPVEVGASGKASIQWRGERGTVLAIELTGYDADGFYGGLVLYPWRVDIPHEEVNFATGHHTIDPSERKKLEASFELLQAAIDKYGAVAKIRLFIAGHTDTVGDAASNRGLSERRARAIGRWFRRRGVRIPIAYAGFGEDLPLVETPDHQDEPRNRRAEYIVAVEAPPMGGRRVPWRSLSDAARSDER